MAEKDQVYHCRICGNIVQVLCGGQGQLVCCGQPMELMVNDVAGGPEGHTFEEESN